MTRLKMVEDDIYISLSQTRLVEDDIYILSQTLRKHSDLDYLSDYPHRQYTVVCHLEIHMALVVCD